MDCHNCKHPTLKKKKKIYCSNVPKLNAFDVLGNIDEEYNPYPYDCVEVCFKNGRKDYFRNVNKLELKCGDMVVVEAQNGYDVGTVTLTEETTRLQMKRRPPKHINEEIKKLYRIAKPADIEKLQYLRSNEDAALIKTRKIISRLGLIMKLIDVEYQGDGSKAIFYYTAEERVDFRELIKVLADEFRCRIEMKQIGVRQEAARLGGIGSCGRELCCANWLTDFHSVSTNSARIQQLSINPQKLAGQCAKLKCCLNYEYDNYYELQKNLPDTSIVLKSKKGEALHQKTEILKQIMWYSYTSDPNVMIPLSAEYVKKIIEMNRKGEMPDEIHDASLNLEATVTVKNDFADVVGQDDIDRFD